MKGSFMRLSSQLNRANMYLLIGMLFVTGSALCAVGKNQSAAIFPPLPKIDDPVASARVTRNAYRFIAAHPEISRYMPCFCTCGKKEGHASLEDCYIKSRQDKPSVIWNEHAGECYICVKVATEARHLFGKGKDVQTIRDEIEKTMAPRFKNHTNTPEPPNTTP